MKLQAGSGACGSHPARALALALTFAAVGCTQDIALPGAPMPEEAGVQEPPPRRKDALPPVFGDAGLAEDPPDGHIHDPDPVADAGATDGRPGTVSYNCSDEITDVRQQNPFVVISLSRSASMQQKLGTSTTTRLAAVQAALRKTIEYYQPGIRFGYQEFPVSASECGGTACCAGAPYLPADDILRVMNKLWSCQGQLICPTPAAEAPAQTALRRCVSFYNDPAAQGMTAARPRYVLLITDSDPSCAMAVPAGGDLCEDALTQTSKLMNEDVKTIVFGVSDKVKASACLDRLAAAGGLPRMATPRHYVAADATQILKQLDGIFSELSKDACRFVLSVPLADPDRLHVHFNHFPLRRDTTNLDGGWEYEQGSTVVFRIYGRACDQLRIGLGNVEAFRCVERDAVRARP
jgi:hypothetical protein